jgi:RND family efflux transporter MFP subunit
VDVFSDVAGKITQVYVEIGSRVDRGASIAAVDPSKPGMYFIPGVASAPIAGTVVALPAQVGATVNQAVPLARISGNNALEIKLYVAERFISKVAMNQSCEVILDAWPGEIFRGTVIEVSPVVDPASRTMEIKLNVTNQDNKLREGMFAKVKLITEQKENIVKIPAHAMIQRFGESYVFVVEDAPPEEADADKPEESGKQYVVRKRIVQPGILIDGVQEILSGLRAGEEFIVKGQTLLSEGSRINIIERVAPLRTER